MFDPNKTNFLSYKEAAPSADPFRDVLLNSGQGIESQGVGEDVLELARGLGKSDYMNGNMGQTVFETDDERNAYYEGIALGEENMNTGGPHGGAEGMDDVFPEGYDEWWTERNASILDYQHNSWTGYVNEKNDRPYDDFSAKLRDIARG